MKRLSIIVLLFSAGLGAQDLLIGSRLGEACRNGLFPPRESSGGVVRLLPRLDRLAMLTCQDTERLRHIAPIEANFVLEAQTTHVLALRQLQLPDNYDAGARLAHAIQARCQADPQQLLLGVVDFSLRQQLLPTPPLRQP